MYLLNNSLKDHARVSKVLFFQNSRDLLILDTDNLKNKELASTMKISMYVSKIHKTGFQLKTSFYVFLKDKRQKLQFPVLKRRAQGKITIYVDYIFLILTPE